MAKGHKVEMYLLNQEASQVTGGGAEVNSRSQFRNDEFLRKSSVKSGELRSWSKNEKVVNWKSILKIFARALRARAGKFH